MSLSVEFEDGLGGLGGVGGGVVLAAGKDFSSAFGPFVGLFGQDHAAQAGDGFPVREDARGVHAAAHLTVVSSPGFCGGRFVWLLPACAGGCGRGWGACLGVECRHPRGQCGVYVPTLEWGRVVLYQCTHLGGVDFNFVDRGPGPFVTDELRLCTREGVESPSSSVFVMKPPVEPREATAFSCAQAAP